MILVNYSSIEQSISVAAAQPLLDRLPAHKAQRLLALRNPLDFTASIMGISLLRLGLDKLQLHDIELADLVYAKPHKPHFAHTEIDFNICHSVDLVICAISLCGQVGVDSEYIHKTMPRAMQHYFDEQEWQSFDNNPQRFYAHWVKKEAVAKASGDGLTAMRNIVIEQDSACYKNTDWHLLPLTLNLTNVSYLASENSHSQIQTYAYTRHNMMTLYQQLHNQEDAECKMCL